MSVEEFTRKYHALSRQVFYGFVDQGFNPWHARKLTKGVMKALRLSDMEEFYG